MLEDKSAETKALSLSFMGWTVVFSLRIAMEGTLIRRKADFDKTLVSKGSTKSIRRKVGKMFADHKAKLRQRGCCKTKVEQQPLFLWKSGSVQYFGEQIVKKFVTKRKKWYSKAGLLG